MEPLLQEAADLPVLLGQDLAGGRAAVPEPGLRRRRGAGTRGSGAPHRGALQPPGPRAALQGADFTARSAEDLSVSRGERLHALREEGGYILARRLAGWPSTGLVPITYVAKAAPETLWNQP
nr:tyrosine-protein kinase Srms [Globicephala melas]